jgi:hypothetical protein
VEFQFRRDAKPEAVETNVSDSNQSSVNEIHFDLNEIHTPDSSDSPSSADFLEQLLKVNDAHRSRNLATW